MFAKRLANLGWAIPEARTRNPTLRNIDVQNVTWRYFSHAEFGPARGRYHTEVVGRIEGSVDTATVTKRHLHRDIAVRPDPNYFDLEAREPFAITHNHLSARLVDVLEALKDLRFPVDFIATEILSIDSR